MQPLNIAEKHGEESRVCQEGYPSDVQECHPDGEAVRSFCQ